MALPVIDKDITTPPGSPADGDTYLVYGVGTGVWAGWQGSVAAYTLHGNYWTRYELSIGNFVYCLDDHTVWAQTDNASPPTWTQVTKAVDALTQVQLSISGTVAPALGMQPGWVRSPLTGAIAEWELIGDVVGAITLDIHKATYILSPPAAASMVGAGTKPALAGAIRNAGTTATWTGSTTVTAGEYLRLEVVAVAGITSCSLALFI